MGQYLLPLLIRVEYALNQMMSFNGLYLSAINTHYFCNSPSNSISSATCYQNIAIVFNITILWAGVLRDLLSRVRFMETFTNNRMIRTNTVETFFKNNFYTRNRCGNCLYCSNFAFMHTSNLVFAGAPFCLCNRFHFIENGNWWAILFLYWNAKLHEKNCAEHQAKRKKGIPRSEKWWKTAILVNNMKYDLINVQCFALKSTWMSGLVFIFVANFKHLRASKRRMDGRSVLPKLKCIKWPASSFSRVDHLQFWIGWFTGYLYQLWFSFRRNKNSAEKIK